MSILIITTKRNPSARSKHLIKCGTPLSIKCDRTNKKILHLFEQSKGLFDRIIELYGEIQDGFRRVFHSFRKDMCIAID